MHCKKHQKPSKKTVYYYPFGLKHKGYNYGTNGGNSVAQKYKYNGKELEESLGLNLYEMDLRAYDPAIARWTGIDPVTHHSMSTYTAFDDNPVIFTDPSGADSEFGMHDWSNANAYFESKGTQEANDGNSPTDNIRINSKTGKVTIHKTDDAFDKIYIDGKYVKTTKKGVTEKQLIADGIKYRKIDAPQGVGMRLTDFVLTVIAAEFLLAKTGIYALFGRAVTVLELVRQAKK
ncbi:MAG: hypothetical protein HWD85_12870 [Flavobacteriaceae bacterium]|nr:hypothetical protein [Flavobacteriaceae bacterium]